MNHFHRPGHGPLRVQVAGSPFQPGDAVRVLDLIDAETFEHLEDPEGLIGLKGTVCWLEYDCGCSQTFPTDPMIGVVFDSGLIEEFWPEELR